MFESESHTQLNTVTTVNHQLSKTNETPGVIAIVYYCLFTVYFRGSPTYFRVNNRREGKWQTKIFFFAVTHQMAI